MADDWKIDRIDTTNVAKAFAEELKGEAKTYFLQGSWGSGKTEYLKEVEKAMNGGKKHFKPFKFVYLELWKPKNKASLAQNILETIHPILYWLKTSAYVALILVSVIASTYISAISIIQKQLSSKEKIWMVILACLIMAFIAHYQNNFFDMDRMVMWIDRKSLQGKHIFRKVLIVDDFDRLDKEMQDELYLFFNQLNGQTRIIFVGDFSKISKNQDNYLSKIIDRQIGLPIQLQSNNIVNLIEKKIRIELDKIDDPNAKYNGFLNTRDFSFFEVHKMFINEKRTARDANQYLGYIQNQLITRNKLDRVDLNQELFIIYLYLFHRDNYDELLDGYIPDIGRYNWAQENKIEETEKAEKTEKTEMEKTMDKVLSTTEATVIKYLQSPVSYYVDDLATSHSLAELMKISKDSEKLTEFFLEDYNSSAEYKEYYNFISDFSTRTFSDDFSFITKVAFEVMASENYIRQNSLLILVIRKQREQIYEEQRKKASKISKDRYVINQFEKYFTEVKNKKGREFSNGKKLFVYRKIIDLFGSQLFEYNQYSKDYFKAIVDNVKKSESFGKNKYDSEVLLYQLGFNYSHQNYAKFYNETPLSIKSTVGEIEKLCGVEYLHFWNEYLDNYADFIRFIGKGDLSKYPQLQFKYKSESYAKHILSRYEHIYEHVTENEKNYLWYKNF